MADTTEALFDEITGVNFKGAYFTILRALPLMPDGGAIVLTSTVAVHFGMPGASIYAAGKAALNSLAKTLAVELAGRRIRVNVISPGPIATPIFGKMGMDKETQAQVTAGLVNAVPLKRLRHTGRNRQERRLPRFRRRGLHHRPGTGRRRRLIPVLNTSASLVINQCC